MKVKPWDKIRLAKLEMTPAMMIQWLGLSEDYDLKELFYDHKNQVLEITISGPGCFAIDACQQVPLTTLVEIHLNEMAWKEK